MMDWTDRLAACLDDPGQVEAMRPLLEDYARTTRRALRLVDRLLGVEDREPDLAHEHERLIIDHHAALARIEAQEHDLETARAWISTLQVKIASVEDEQARDAVYATVGLGEAAHDVVVVAARRALLAHLHPDRARFEDKARASASFARASAAFDRIIELRRC